MTTTRKIDLLSSAFRDIFWMAVRYAHGRRTYAPTIVREALSKYRMVYPNWFPETDKSIKEERTVNGEIMSSDFGSLLDLVAPNVDLVDVDVRLSGMDKLKARNEELETENQTLRGKILELSSQKPLSSM